MTTKPENDHIHPEEDKEDNSLNSPESHMTSIAANVGEDKITGTTNSQVEIELNPDLKDGKNEDISRTKMSQNNLEKVTNKQGSGQKEPSKPMSDQNDKEKITVCVKYKNSILENSYKEIVQTKIKSIVADIEFLDDDRAVYKYLICQEPDNDLKQECETLAKNIENNVKLIMLFSIDICTDREAQIMIEQVFQKKNTDHKIIRKWYEDQSKYPTMRTQKPKDEIVEEIVRQITKKIQKKLVQNLMKNSDFGILSACWKCR